MVTAILILLAVLVVVGFFGVCYQMATSPLLWIMHACNGSLSILGELFVAILNAISEANR